MRNQNLFTKTSLSSYITPLRHQRSRRFTRKPSQCSQRSLSRKSFDLQEAKQTYIKSPSGTQRSRNKHQDFFATLASSIMKKSQVSTEKKNDGQKYKCQPTERTGLTQFQHNNHDMRFHFEGQKAITNLNNKIQTLEAEIDLRNHQTSILQGQRQRLKKTVQQQKQRRKKLETEKKQLTKQVKDLHKTVQTLKAQIKKTQKQRQCLHKQIQFLQRINFDDKTRSLQSYRESYLSQELQRIRKQYHKSRGEREIQLQSQLKIMKEEKYTVQSHLKAVKLANQCLHKQMCQIIQNVQNFVQNTEQYKILKDKYIKLLKLYQKSKQENWTLKSQKKTKIIVDQSDIFSFSASQIQLQLSSLDKQIQKEKSTIQVLSHPPHYNHHHQAVAPNAEHTNQQNSPILQLLGPNLTVRHPSKNKNKQSSYII